MYETEAGNIVDAGNHIPSTVLSAMNNLEAVLLSRTVLPWSEHCTECVWPTCYQTCEFYVPRSDGRCRRFLDGMVRVSCRQALNGYLLKISFKRWAKLWTPGNVRLFNYDKALRMELVDFRIGALLSHVPLPQSIKRRLINKRYDAKKQQAIDGKPSDIWPTSFMIECYNPNSSPVSLSLTMRSFTNDRLPFQALLECRPGFHRLRIPIANITQHLNIRQPFHIEIIPNDIQDGTTLFFGLLDFVRESSRTTPKVKCIVWDLDNTLWDGILIEDGPRNVRLKTGVADVIRELDRRGILHSIASKNNASDAVEELKTFHLDEYFLCPQISWEPKSHGIENIVAQLNIGRDTVMFVDDSEFEREQVKASLPGVQVLDAKDCLSLPQLPQCDVPVTHDSVNRRRMYQVEAARTTAAKDFGNDYRAFLKHCNIKVYITSLSNANIERVYELTQRTNQMNFSGNRYSREVLKQIMVTPHLDTYVLRCEDRFGTYGIIGFSIVDRCEPRMTDLMFSCRVQSKRVEHAFLTHVIRKYILETGKDFHATYNRTSRNEPAGRVFKDLNMTDESGSEGLSSLIFHKHQPIPDDDVVQIVTSDVECVA